MSDAHWNDLELLRQRIYRILELYTLQRTENEQLRKLNGELEEKLQVDHNKFKTLEGKYNKLKISKALIASSENMHEAKMKVNRMVREIDKCIALLNR